LKRFFHPSEYKTFSRSKSKARSFALLFAAKEAASKAMELSIQHPALFKQFKISFSKNEMTLRWAGKSLHMSQKPRFKLIPFESGDSLGVIALFMANQTS